MPEADQELKEPGTWLVYRDRAKAFVGKLVQHQRDGQVLINSGTVKNAEYFQDWMADDTGLITSSKLMPTNGKHKLVEYIIERRAILGRFPSVAGSEKVPTPALKLLAEFRRDPKKFPF